ncbi:MAG: hypothetical protein AB7O67_17725 [Vicinamibacterales bacterium]
MSRPRFGDQPEVGRDVLDAQIGVAELRPLGLGDVLGRSRAALGLRPLTAPALVFVPLGVALGPAGLGWISIEVLGYLYPVAAVALAILGLFVGLGFDPSDADERRLLGVASTEALISIVVVGGAFAALLWQWNLPLDVAIAPLALVFGVCAAATSSGIVRPDDPEPYRRASRIAELDDVLPIVLGGLVLAMYTGTTTLGVLYVAALNIGAAVAVALAGGMLFERAKDPAERAVFVLGVITLLGGGAQYLGVSPLLAGMVAGLVWRFMPGDADAVVRADLLRLQHPLVLLLLIFAGASAQFGTLALWLAGPYVLMRLCGKLLGGWVLNRLTPSVSPADLGSYLLPPGVIGLSFALSFHLVALSSGSAAALTAVAAGTLASEVLAALALLGPRKA